MKKFISVFLSLAMVLTMFATTPLTASAETYTTTIDGIKYEIDTETGEAEVDDAESSITAANILSEVDGYKVTSIGYEAFYKCTSLTAVTIPDSVTSIGNYAFRDCTSLTEVTIGDSVTSIGDYAFWYCISLTEVTIGGSVTSIGNWAFCITAYYYDETNWENGVLYIDNCLIEAKTSISGDYTIKDGTRLIADEAFYKCTSLTEVTIPDSVTSIGGSAFEDCTSLTTVTIPDSVTSIGDETFRDCTSLTSVTIPDSVTSIGEHAFYNTAYYNNETNWENDVLYIDNCLILANIAKDSISCDYTIKDGTRLIADNAFYYCTSLTAVTIPDSVTSIGDMAFYNCTSLTAVTIPDSVTSIGSSAFENCTSLTAVTIPDRVTSIGSSAFGYYYDNEYKKVENFTIYGYTGSAAETYANNNGFTFVELEYAKPEFKGDCNGDGKVSVADARKLVVAIAKGDTQALLEFGDVNGDGKVSVADVRKIVIAIAKGDFNF